MNINDIKAALAQRANGLKMPVVTGATAPIPADNAVPDNGNNAAPAQEAVSTAKPDVKAEASDNNSAIQASVKVAEEKPKRTRKSRTAKPAKEEQTTPENPENKVQEMTESIEVVVAKILKPYADYGVIQGCKKPSLLKAGAEKLAAYYGYSTSIEVVNRYENYDKGLVAYEIKVTVCKGDGSVIAEGIGAANSRERKFLRGDFFSQINTVLKMAKKRAYVDAILTATGSSSLFTQDMEDIAAGDTNGRMESVG